MKTRVSTFRLWAEDFASLFAPRCCAACDTVLMRFEEVLCTGCLNELPRTRFHEDPANRVQRLFHGRVELQACSAWLHFTGTGMVQRVLHRIKYANVPSKERKRGYNQSQLVVDGMLEAWPRANPRHALARTSRTATQTKRGRLDRWSNVKDAFVVADGPALAGKHILLVDDVVTTGATIEACALALREAGTAEVSVFAIACA
ncbi:MAG: ComF family protein [Flavobacteriales bacterium]|nr:ComF family protein [Flavobacteriales bacterium]